MKYGFKSFYISLMAFILMTIGFTPIASAEEKHSLFTGVLKDYVREGLVDYKNLCKDERLDQYLKQVSDTDPTPLLKYDSMAFWINAYNVFTLDLICQNYPIKSINQLHSGGLIFGGVIGKTAWDKPFITINEKIYSLGQIEHKILRPQYKDPRIHFALVCAARSCPPLRSEAYEGFRLSDQLNDQGKIFLINRADLNSFDLDHNIANLSSIFSWFLKDFGKNSKQLLEYLSVYLPDNVSADIKANLSGWKIKYNKYDWSLNEQ